MTTTFKTYGLRRMVIEYGVKSCMVEKSVSVLEVRVRRQIGFFPAGN